jgi:hypothetical protein
VSPLIPLFTASAKWVCHGAYFKNGRLAIIELQHSKLQQF